MNDGKQNSQEPFVSQSTREKMAEQANGAWREAALEDLTEEHEDKQPSDGLRSPFSRLQFNARLYSFRSQKKELTFFFKPHGRIGP